MILRTVYYMLGWGVQHGKIGKGVGEKGSEKRGGGGGAVNGNLCDQNLPSTSDQETYQTT